MSEEILKDLFVSTLKAENTVFDDFEETNENTVKLCLEGDNLDINVYVSFIVTEDDSIMVTLSSFDLPNFSGRLADGAIACNTLNDDEFVKYYIDDEGDAIAHALIIFSQGSHKSEFSARQVLIMANALAFSVDEAYPILKAV